MKAVVYHGIGDIRPEEVPEPEIRDPADAIVRLTATAICGCVSVDDPDSLRSRGLEPVENGIDGDRAPGAEMLRAPDREKVDLDPSGARA